MRHAGILVLLLAACGGGGGSPPPEPLQQSLGLGLVRADAPSIVRLSVVNPFDKDATVEEVEAPADGFEIVDGQLPGVAGADAPFSLDLRFTPSVAVGNTDELRIRFRADGRGEQDVILFVNVEVEAPGIQLVTPTVDFGSVLVGQTRTMGVTVRNPNQLTPVRVLGVSAPPADFRLNATTPFTIAPGQTFGFAIDFTPTGLAQHSFQIDISHSEGAFPLGVDVTANAETWLSEVIHDFGDVTVAGDETEWLEVELTPHAVSLSLEVVGPDNATVGLLGLEGPGRVYENAAATGAHLWSPGEEGVFTATVPQSDREELLLVEGGGLYRFRFFVLQGSASTFAVRAIVHNRPAGINNAGALDLNVYLAPGLAIEFPGSETRLQGILARTDEILGQQGLQLGSISYFQLEDDDYDDVDSNDFPSLLAESSVAPDVRLNLFFVQKTLSGGVLGVAARIAGPALNGTRISGVMVDYDFGSASTAGHVTAHEIGHYIGLYHTAESGGGGHDIIDDTAECPSSGTSAACPTEGNDYLMHWRVLSVGLPVVTDGQGLVILAHPLVREPSGLTGLAQRVALPPPGPLDAVPDGWCGTACCTK